MSAPVITYEVDEERGILHVRIRDGLTPALLVSVLEQLRADPRHAPFRPALFDLREMRRAPTIEGLHELAEAGRNSPIDPSTPRALLVNAGAPFEVAHQFSIIAQRHGKFFGVFNDHEAAVRWLAARPRPQPD